jgi:hypothetical protein
MRRKRALTGLQWVPSLGFTTAIALLIVSCSSSYEGETRENLPPVVTLSGAPPEGSVDEYRIKFFWAGWDPDGDVAYYEYCITDNEGGTFDPADTVGSDKWAKVYSNDSTFSFTADRLEDDGTDELVAEFRRSHTFFIRAVDTEGLASVEPAYRSFTARTLSPEVSILIPRRVALNPADVPPITTFRWIATDYVSDQMTWQDPDSVSWILEPKKLHSNDWNETIAYIRNLPVDSDEWEDWVWYQAPEDSGKYWTTPPLDFGNYVFAIRAKDEAGAVTPVFDEAHNMRRINVSSRKTGPLLIVRNQYLGNVVTMVCNHPLRILDLPAGIPVDFSWTADASDYGGIEAGYRYGWDIKDLNDPTQWDVDYSPFPPPPIEGDPPGARSTPRTFNFGTHVFTIEVIDDSGFCSRAEVKVNVVQFTMENDLLFVDDFREEGWTGWSHPQGRGIEPTDEEQDFFWLDSEEGILKDVDGFNTTEDVIDTNELAGGALPLQQMAKYKSIIWNTKGHKDRRHDLPKLFDLVKFRPKTGEAVAGKQEPNLVALFMAAGGHVLICGSHPVANVVDLSFAERGLKYPMIFKYDLDLRAYSQEDAPTVQMVANPPGDESFAYFELCLETMEYSLTDVLARRSGGYHCSNSRYRWVPITVEEQLEYLRTRTMRAAIPLNPEFPRLELRPETALPGKAHGPESRGLDVELYNQSYFFDICSSVLDSRECFEPIYGLECFEESEVTYGQPIAFWTSTFAHVEAEAPGTIPARSALFGFAPVYFKPDQVRGAIENVVFDEWQLQRK